MQTFKTLRKQAALAICIFMLSPCAAFADPGDSTAVAKARKDYAQALKSKDIGRINAMKIELSVQLAKQKAQQDVTSSKPEKTASSK
jgi:hypothetical protein